jgi:ankyrin repeat protein
MLSHRFRWVSCQLEVLRHCFPVNLRRTLEGLPKSLDETYKRILNEINNANQVHAYRLLQCLTVALRPLRVEELADMLAFDLTEEGIPVLNPDWRWEDQEEAVLSACSSLVSVIIDDGSRVVQFSHFSVKEFLTSSRLASCKEEVSQFHIPIEPSHAILAQTCLGVFLCLDDHTDKHGAEEIPLYRYAAQYWVEHAQVRNVESQIMDVLDYFFDMDNPHFSAWARIEHPHDLFNVSIDEEPTSGPRPAAPLYFAAWRGLPGLVERLIIKRPQQLTQLGGLYGTPLHASVLGGHIEISQLLVARGADINLRCADNWTPLHIALYMGRLDITKWLLKHGADVNSQDKHGWTPLHFSADKGHVEACRMLLEHKPELNYQNDHGSTPFCFALENGRLDVAQLLLDHNADVRIPNNKGNTPLHFSASRGYLEVSRRLLELNAEVDLRNNDGTTPFLRALERGHPDVARLLLDKNANVRVRSGSRNTPLHFAAKRGLLETAQIILERGAEVNPQNDEGSTPLHLASKVWSEESSGFVQLLLDRGADVQVRDLNGKTASEVASGPKQEEIVRLLSQHSEK